MHHLCARAALKQRGPKFLFGRRLLLAWNASLFSPKGCHLCKRAAIVSARSDDGRPGATETRSYPACF